MPTIKTKYSKISVDNENNIQRIDLCNALKKVLSGSFVEWIDSNPCGYSGDMVKYAFDIKTPMASRLMLKIAGVYDPMTFIKCHLHWNMKMEMVYSKPNRGEVEHVETLIFNFHGKPYPLPADAKDRIDSFFMAKNLEFSAAPDTEKNKKVFREARFVCTVI
jgi:hypothetical protein